MSDDAILAAIELRRAVADRLPDLTPRGSSRRDPLEVRCRAFLEKLRWPGGVACPRCDESNRLHWLESRDKWHCYACRYQFSVTAGTLFHRSHLPLWKWFASIHLMTATEDGVTALELAEQIGGSYKSHWFTTHRIRIAMQRTRVTPLGAAERRRPSRARRRGTVKYRAAYDVEHSWRDANRSNRRAITDVIRALLEAEPVSYYQLTRRLPMPLAA